MTDKIGISNNCLSNHDFRDNEMNESKIKVQRVSLIFS